RAAPAAPASRGEVDARDAPRDQGDAGGAEGREPLAEHHQRNHGHERYAEAPRDRVDTREVAMPVGAAQRVEVHRVDRDGRDHEGNGGGRDPLAGGARSPTGSRITVARDTEDQRKTSWSRAPLASAFQTAWSIAAAMTRASASPVTRASYGTPGRCRPKIPLLTGVCRSSRVTGL